MKANKKTPPGAIPGGLIVYYIGNIFCIVKYFPKKIILILCCGISSAGTDTKNSMKTNTKTNMKLLHRKLHRKGGK